MSSRRGRPWRIRAGNCSTAAQRMPAATAGSPPGRGRQAAARDRRGVRPSAGPLGAGRRRPRCGPRGCAARRRRRWRRCSGPGPRRRRRSGWVAAAIARQAARTCLVVQVGAGGQAERGERVGHGFIGRLRVRRRHPGCRVSGHGQGRGRVRGGVRAPGRGGRPAAGGGSRVSGEGLGRATWTKVAAPRWM